MTPRTLKNIKSLERNIKKLNLTDVYVFDIDNTIFESVGTYEQDYNLDKFEMDNTFFRNLALRRLPCFYSIERYFDKIGKYGTRNIVVLQTARSKKWWLPLILFLKGVRYDVLIQRPKFNNMDSGKLKRTQLIDLIMFRRINIGNLFFIDDSKINRDEIDTLKFAITYNADELNKTAIKKSIDLAKKYKRGLK
tara:strand:- start:544 stop:1122 length:579 start_codon:yes stop_codon:yes gene_type:complete